MQELVADIGRLVDDYQTVNAGRKTRDIVIPEEDQQVLIKSVRIVGNLCFQCRLNQDLLRTTEFPPVNGTTENRTDHQCGERANGLHVLLSSTSFSYSCFTLREWAVIAIRSVLDGNESNQAVVAALEAQRPVQSSALSDMGIRVDLTGGNVSVIPLDGDQTQK
jgi:ataxin-10